MAPFFCSIHAWSFFRYGQEPGKFDSATQAILDQPESRCDNFARKKPVERERLGWRPAPRYCSQMGHQGCTPAMGFGTASLQHSGTICNQRGGEFLGMAACLSAPGGS